MVNEIDKSIINKYVTTSARVSRPVVMIGALIRDELQRQERTVTWLSRKIHCDRRNIYDIFSRDSIDTSLLMRISMALGVDFFKAYSDIMQAIENEGFTPPRSSQSGHAV